MQFWTWASLRDSIRQAIPKPHRTCDLPHALQDHINAWPKDFQSLPDTKLIFEAMIVENTMEDEPDSPHIKIINVVDSQPTPPFEFHYSMCSVLVPS
jgi:[histone H3]-lysine9 N-trimethyltransferase SUV39H